MKARGLLTAPVSIVRWAWSGAFLGLLGTFAAFAPAAWLASAIASSTDGRVLLTEPRGSIWSGSSGLVLSGGEGSAGAVSLPSRVNWQLAPHWLGLDVELHAPCCTPQAPLNLQITAQSFSTASVALIAAPFELPARMLSGLGAPWNTLQLDGTLALSTRNLVSQWSSDQGLQQLTGQASLDATAIQTALSTVKPLGSYRVTLAGGTIRLETLAEQGAADAAALVLTGSGEWSVNSNGRSKASFKGEALAAVGREAALSNLLHIIGQRQPSSDGRIRALLSLG